MTKLEQENEINSKKNEEFETRLNQKEGEIVSRRLTYEVYEDQLNKLQKQTESTGIDNRVSIDQIPTRLKTTFKRTTSIKISS